jgi:hypothetical protein
MTSKSAKHSLDAQTSMNRALRVTMSSSTPEMSQLHVIQEDVRLRVHEITSTRHGLAVPQRLR